jgi:sugar fermentation stimulation protein A
MQLPPLIEARLVQRYKRFFVDAQLEDGQIVTAHCPNPGRMSSVLAEGQRIWLSKSPSLTRRLAWTWELAEAPEGGFVGVNTTRPNKLVAEALLARALPEVAEYTTVVPEVGIAPGVRVDFCLTHADGSVTYLEVKNVHLREGETALFPDCVTARGTKHLYTLTKFAMLGTKTAVIYVVQRSDCRSFGVASHLDPIYAAAAKAADEAGVKFFAYQCEVSRDEIRLQQPLPIEEYRL